MTSSPSFQQRVYGLVARIPPGRVTTYGEIAAWLGSPGGARTVGWAMNGCPDGLPWQRVLGSAGGKYGRLALRPSHGAEEQRSLLEAEGVVFDAHGHVDLARYGWDGKDTVETLEGATVSLPDRVKAASSNVTTPIPQMRRLPAVDKLLREPRLAQWVAQYGRQLALEATRLALDEQRAHIVAGGTFGGTEALLDAVQARLEASAQPTLRPVINASGVILHTNLGRAPLSADVLAAMRTAGEGYSNLEFDLATGERGSRYVHAEDLLCRLTGAEAALLVNNNAGAVLLALSALATGREVVISRGQLVEIGGGFRIPDVMAQSGAHLVEVGTTNRTYVEDYATAIGEQTAALMRVHTSNFRLSGFVHQASLAELSALAHARGLWLLDDLGSGTLLDTQPYGLPHEPTVQESLAGGADLVLFSGDKLLGGPQAGIIVGKGALVERLRRFPLTRALRVDKTTIAGIQANLLHYVKGEALDRIPVWRMIAMSQEEVTARAQRLVSALGGACDLVAGRSMIGGGSLPEESLPTTLIALPGASSEALAAKLRTGYPAVLARVQDDRVVLDLRTVLPGQEEALLARLREVS
jgi:L-seryl-tRNA(Ser) seleniumtransferase